MRVFVVVLSFGALSLAGATAACQKKCGHCLLTGSKETCASSGVCNGCSSQCESCLKSHHSSPYCLRYCSKIYDEAELILGRSSISKNTWTIMMTNRWMNATYFVKSQNTPRMPASNNKLWTTACAFELFGGQAKYPYDHDRTMHQAMKDILKPSDNDLADHLLQYIGSKKLGTSDMAQAGKYVLQWAQKTAGLNMSGAHMLDGSGLSRSDHYTAKQIVSLVKWMLDKKPDEGWKSGLPVGCVDGTLAGRFCGSHTKGLLHAKTGTLHDVHAVSGWIKNKFDGETYLFSVITNSANDATASVQAIDDIAALMGEKHIPTGAQDTSLAGDDEEDAEAEGNVIV